ncbi:MAG: TonB-dependent receptor, partial [Acidobacteriota bacterium]
QGSVDTEDFTRTTPNPIDRQQTNALLQLSVTPSDTSEWRAAVEVYDTEAETEVFSSRNPGSPFASAVLDSDGFDTQERTRFSLSNTSTSSSAAFDTSLFRAYFQTTDTVQETIDIRQPFIGVARRDGLLTFDQENLGLDVELTKAVGSGSLLTYGLEVQRETFDQLRDRSEFVIATGAPVPTSLAFPTKYFPESEVTETGLFAQLELSLLGGRLSLVPGVRFDRYDLDADQNDAIFLAGNPGTPAPVDYEEDSVSPKLGLVLDLTDDVSVFAQYAEGFRAPPMSAVNNGFTNFGGGYRTLPNPDLEAETSDNLELGLRASGTWGSFSIAGFVNQYEDFIETVFLGFNPAIFLVEFQPQNVTEVEISGLELAGEWRFGRAWTLRGSYTYTEGDNEVSDEPLESIAPAQLVLGLRYRANDGRWGAELIGTATASKDASDLPTGSTQFQVPSQEVFDLAAWFALTDQLELQLTVWNLTDETAWNWYWVRGQSQTSSTLDRFTMPGVSGGLQVRYVF